MDAEALSVVGGAAVRPSGAAGVVSGVRGHGGGSSAPGGVLLHALPLHQASLGATVVNHFVDEDSVEQMPDSRIHPAWTVWARVLSAGRALVAGGVAPSCAASSSEISAGAGEPRIVQQIGRGSPLGHLAG